MKKILFPTAYSAHSVVAFRYTQQLAQHFGASITLVHIYQKTPFSLLSKGRQVSEEIKQFEDEQWQLEMDKLVTFAKELSEVKYQDIVLDFIATEGSVSEQLLYIQQENNFDLFVMGTQRHPFVGRIFGNTTYNLIDEVTCPLLLIPPEAHFIEINTILYGTAFKVNEQESIHYLLDWCLAFNAKLSVLHIHKKENNPQSQFNMRSLMDGFVAEERAGIINAEIKAGNIREELEFYIKKNNVDMLAIHRRKQGLLQEMIEGSLTKLLSEEIKIPLLVLKS